MGDEEVQPAVIVVVAPGRRHGVAAVIQPGLGRDFGKRPVAVIAVQQVRAIDGDEEVEVPVVVIVADRATDAARAAIPPSLIHAQGRRHIDEAAPVIAPQGVGGAGLVGQEQVQVAVAVIVQPTGADGGANVVDAALPHHRNETAVLIAEELVRPCTVRRIEVQRAVVVVVDPVGLAAHPSRHDKPQRLGLLHKTQTAVVAPDEGAIGRAIAHDVRSAHQVDEPVAVEVAPAQPPNLDARGRQSHLRADVDESAAVIAIEAGRRRCRSRPRRSTERPVPKSPRPEPK